MANGMTKSQITAKARRRGRHQQEAAAAFFEAQANLAYKEAKNSFTLPGLGKLVLTTSAARRHGDAIRPQQGPDREGPRPQRLKFRVAKAAKDAILGARSSGIRPSIFVTQHRPPGREPRSRPVLVDVPHEGRGVPIPLMIGRIAGISQNQNATMDLSKSLHLRRWRLTMRHALDWLIATPVLVACFLPGAGGGGRGHRRRRRRICAGGHRQGAGWGDDHARRRAFPEHVTITKPLTLQGAGWDKTTLGPTSKCR